jgi:hypothetical protein
MKKLYLFFFFLTLTLRLVAQDCSALQFSYSATESRCMATGSISIQATGGSGSYNYKVTGPVNKSFTSSQLITGLQSGYYQVTVKDVNTGCTRMIDSVHVPGDYQDPRFQLEYFSVSCAGNDGFIGLSSQQYGRGPFTFSLIAPSPMGVGTTNSSGDFSGLIPGEYHVQMKDSCGGIQVRRVTIESYSWWFDALSVTRVGCDSADVFIRLADNRGELNVGGSAFTGFSYGVVNSPGDTTWFPGNSFRAYTGKKRSVTVVARDACGNIHAETWYLPNSVKPSVGSLSFNTYGCTTFNAVVPSQQNLTSPRFCLVKSPSDTIACNTTGSFTNIPYGTYCIYIKDDCYDTTIQRCFTVNKPTPSVNNSVSISSQNCTTFTATVTGQQNLINPNYCLYDAANTLVTCNSNGVFTNLAYGSYCIRVANGCSDTTIQRCFTVARPLPVLNTPVISSATCSTFTVSSSGSNIYGPATYCIYDSQGNVIACNSTGVFTGLGYGNYCVRAVTACGDSTAAACFGATPPLPAVAASVQTTNLTCYSFTASITGQQNLTSPEYCLYNSSNVLVRCNTTGVFDNLPYGSYCIRLTNTCYDTVITRCFSRSQPQPSVNATMEISNKACSTFSARVVGTNLSTPSYCLYNAQDSLLACNATGIFNNLAYGSYCVRVNDGCVDTTMTVCQTVTEPAQISVATEKSCSIGYANVAVQFDSGSAPYVVRVYHPNGSIVHTANSSSASVLFLLPHLAEGQYKIVGEDQCGRKDTAMLSANASVVTKSVTVKKKCPSAEWQDGSGDLEVTCSSNWYGVLPAIIKKNNVNYSKGFSSRNGNTFLISDLEPATYIVEYTLQTCNTKVYDTVTVAPYSYPQPGQSAIYQCDNNSFSLGADVAGGINPYSFQIIGSVPEVPSIASLQQVSPIFTINNGTKYSLIRLRAIDACGNATLADVSVLPLQNIAVTASATCFYHDITLSVDTIPNALYTWYRKTSPTDSVVIGSGLTYNLPFFRPEEVGTYVCKASVNDGCLSRISSFTLTGDCGQVVLPISWSLEGKALKGANQLAWIVPEERGIAQYEVERVKGGAFVAIGRVPARNTAQASVYQFMDRNAVGGINLYRIKIIYNDGRVEYSNTVTLRQSGGVVMVYPNPAKDVLQVQVGSGDGEYRMEVLTASGQVADVREWKQSGAETYRYDRGKLSPGVYVVRIYNRKSGQADMHKVVFE